MEAKKSYVLSEWSLEEHVNTLVEGDAHAAALVTTLPHRAHGGLQLIGAGVGTAGYQITTADKPRKWCLAKMTTGCLIQEESPGCLLTAKGEEPIQVEPTMCS